MRTEGEHEMSESFSYWKIWLGFKRGLLVVWPNSKCWPEASAQRKRALKNSLNGSLWEVTSQSFSPRGKGFPGILKDQSVQVMSPLTPFNQIYILSLPATPIV